MKREFKKPLIIMAPKSLLRHKACVSAVADFTDANFESILDDTSVDKQKVKRLIFCSGKLYYDLEEKRVETNDSQSALIRIEQLYPLNEERLQQIKSSFSAAEQLVWCQEEPKIWVLGPF